MRHFSGKNDQVESLSARLSSSMNVQSSGDARPSRTKSDLLNIAMGIFSSQFLPPAQSTKEVSAETKFPRRHVVVSSVLVEVRRNEFHPTHGYGHQDQTIPVFA